MESIRAHAFRFGSVDLAVIGQLVTGDDGGEDDDDDDDDDVKLCVVRDCGTNETPYERQRES